MKPFVKVIWHDATDDDRTWLKEADAVAFGELPLAVTSWGWLIGKSRHYITLAADFIPDTQHYGRVTKIPKAMLVKIEEFKQD